MEKKFILLENGDGIRTFVRIDTIVGIGENDDGDVIVSTESDDYYDIVKINSLPVKSIEEAFVTIKANLNNE